MTGIGVEIGAQAARSRALAVLRVRGRALAVALLPAAAAVILLAGGPTGHFVGRGWDVARWIVSLLAVLVLLGAAGIALVVARARPAVSPTVPVPEESAPDLYRMVRDLADRLDVPAPSAIALTPDCDSWLEDRTHSAHGPPPRPAPGEDELAGPGRRRASLAPVLVIGSPFLWWMRVGELRAVLAPVIAGTGPSAHPDIAAARRFVRGLDAAVAVASTPGRCPATRGVCAALGWVARLLLRGCREHATQMERGVAAAAAERAQAVDYGLRIVAQEQVGLAYAGWDRLLTRVALPAWRMGRWPSRLDAGVVAALTELSRRDRLAEGFTSRLGERPACDLLEEPGAVDEAASLLAARLFHGGPAESRPDWAPVDWQAYPEEVVDRTWRADAARLHRVLDSLGVRPSLDPATPDPGGPTLARVLDHLTERPTEAAIPKSPHHTPRATAAEPGPGAPQATDGEHGPAIPPVPQAIAAEPGPGAPQATDGEHGPAIPPVPQATAAEPGPGAPQATDGEHGPAIPPVPQAIDGEPGPGAPQAIDGEHGPAVPPVPQAIDGEDAAEGPLAADDESRTDGPGPGGNPDAAAEAEASRAAEAAAAAAAEAEAFRAAKAPQATREAEADPATDDPGTERSAALAAGLSAALAREEAGAPRTGATATGRSPESALWDDTGLPLFPLQPPRTARDLLTEHVTAMVCCAAVDTADAVPALDWLDGPSLLLGGERAADLTPRVLSLIEEGDPGPLRDWLAASGIRPEKPVRLV
ncbi:hypothetical protein SRB17_36720 [Streptomyces sp. RB17]|uniref:hypothetical protein n=1 Tax=Streptomyces sp. RB17 TaxID=2585197 RepID=UPI00130C5F62|nr:hypothetical protein [Streptomyces sp. RB17]MQY35685.1 hypothetical protein [Streptomyces sp. RB17]